MMTVIHTPITTILRLDIASLVQELGLPRVGGRGIRGKGPPDRARSVPLPREGGSRKTAAFVKDRKSTRLNSSHRCISYAVFCLKKKKNRPNETLPLAEKR